MKIPVHLADALEPRLLYRFGGVSNASKRRYSRRTGMLTAPASCSSGYSLGSRHALRRGAQVKCVESFAGGDFEHRSSNQESLLGADTQPRQAASRCRDHRRRACHRPFERLLLGHCCKTGASWRGVDTICLGPWSDAARARARSAVRRRSPPGGELAGRSNRQRDSSAVSVCGWLSRRGEWIPG